MGPFHRVAAALLVEGDRVLLAHRHPRREHYPDCWDVVGGHIEAGETPEQALVRECREELGVTISDPCAVALATEAPDLQMHAFVVRAWTGAPSNRAPEEHDEVRWFHLEELASLTLAHPALTDLVAEALTPAGPPFATG